jgi:hypothetical protein
MDAVETVLVLLMVSVSMGLVLEGVWWFIDVEDRLRNGFLTFALLAYLVMVYVGSPSVWLSSGVVVLASVAGAMVIGSFNRSRGSVVMFLVTAAVIDWFSFSGGLTRWIIDSGGAGNPLLLQYLTVALPVGGRVRYLIGIGDLLITGAAGLSLFRLGYPALRTGMVLVFSILLAVLVALRIGGIPALPVVALVMGLYVSIQSVE